MRKLLFTFVMTAFFTIFSMALFGQTMNSYESEHYIVHSELGADHAETSAEKMEAFYTLFQDYFHFPSEELNDPLKVKIFKEKSSYDSYIKSIISETRDSFVFLHYGNKPEKSELIAFQTEDPELFSKRLIHHGFIQYFKSFIPNPPLWLQKGFAVYFENSRYNDSKNTAVYKENYGWVPFIRSRLNKERENIDLIPLNTLLYIDPDTANRNLESFYAQSWGMVEFLVHSENKSYNRILWDSISALRSPASLRENEKATVREAFRWVNRESLVSDFIRYMRKLKTFPDLIDLGMEAYSKENFDKSEQYFLDALKLNDKHYVPHYYLGLIYYEKSEYSMAEYYYQSAKKAGGNTALIDYALGVNAFADNRFEDARRFLKSSKEKNSSYVDKVDSLLKRIDNAERPSED